MYVHVCHYCHVKSTILDKIEFSLLFLVCHHSVTRGRHCSTGHYQRRYTSWSTFELTAHNVAMLLLKLLCRKLAREARWHGSKRHRPARRGKEGERERRERAKRHQRCATRVSRGEAGEGGGHRGGMLLEHSFRSCSVNFSLCANWFILVRQRISAQTMVQREEGFGCSSRSDGDEKIQKCAGNLTQISGDFVLRVSGDSILAQNLPFDMADNDMYLKYYTCTCNLHVIYKLYYIHKLHVVL